MLEDLRFAFRHGVVQMVECSWCPNPGPTPQVNERACLRDPPRKDHRGVDLISDALPFGGLWHGEPNAISNVVDYAKLRSRSHHAVIRVYDEAGNVLESHEHNGNFKEW